VNSVLWVQSAAEFQAASLQTYGLARKALDEALADPSRIGALEEDQNHPEQPPALIVDGDETIFDNTAFEARMIQAHKTYDAAAWKQWVGESAAKAMPGVTQFLDYARSRGVIIFYVTNRDEDERAGTRRNIERLGLPLADPKQSDKSGRRREVAETYRIVMLIGDDMNDFADLRSASRQEREAMVKKMASWWGTRWFLVPNPMYGSFERAAIGSGGTPCEIAERKVRALVP
jgi:5'-nucleotidase (lipoprotein e(P4) family)